MFNKFSILEMFQFKLFQIYKVYKMIDLFHILCYMLFCYDWFIKQEFSIMNLFRFYSTYLIEYMVH